MIQKKKFSDAIAANISVVGELLGVPNIITLPTLSARSKTVGEVKEELRQLYLNNKKGLTIIRIPIFGFIDLAEYWTNNDYIISRQVYGMAIFETYNNSYVTVTLKSYSLDAYRTVLRPTGFGDEIKKY